MARTNKNKKELIITRIFDAPRKMVWQVWTNAEMVKKWWGPKDFSAPTIKIDFRVGGKYLYCMHGVAIPGAEAKDYWSGGTYREIIPMEKIVVTDHFSDETGNMVDPTKYGMNKNFPKKMDLTTKFEDMGGKTKLSLLYAIPETDAAYEAMVKSGMDVGWNQSLDKLAKALTKA